MPPEPGPTSMAVTELLVRWRNGDREAANDLFELLYLELRARARGQRARRGLRDSLATTSLVNEAFVRLAGGKPASATDRRHFLAIAARAMRHVLVDRARRRAAARRDGGTAISLDENVIGQDARASDLLALDSALEDLGRLDPRLATIVELRFFAGRSVDEVADVVGLSSRSVVREWRKARAFLARQLG